MPRSPKTAAPAAIQAPDATAATTPVKPTISKTAAIAAALQAHPDKMPKELAEIMKGEGWDIKPQTISVVKSKLKDRNQRKARRKPTTKAAPVEAPAVAPVSAATMAEEGISFDSLKKAKQMAEQLGGIQQAKAAIAALAELVD